MLYSSTATLRGLFACTSVGKVERPKRVSAKKICLTHHQKAPEQFLLNTYQHLTGVP